MRELDAVLIAFREGTRCDAAVWTIRDKDAESPTLIAKSSMRVTKPDSFPSQGSIVSAITNEGYVTVAAVPGVRRTWVSIAPCEGNNQPSEVHLRLLLPVVSQILRGAQEVEQAAVELAERYEEINLLYTIGEILGRTVTLEEAASTILTEISETVGAANGSILVHDPARNILQVVAAIGTDAKSAAPIPVDDAEAVSARVFRTQHPLTVAAGVMENDAERPYRRGEMLSVPIMWTTPSGGEPLGVVNLSGRRTSQPYSAGDQKLVLAIATQIGTAIQNARLVRSSIEQQRLMQEMYLAHDLQMKLLPKTSIVAPEVSVAARVVPAESVGGDFYHLFRMPRNRTGIMIGDVSGHGYRAALIMALAMSASAIHAQSAKDPAEMLSLLLGSMREELATTDMYISACYVVLDHANARLRFANTGHPHAFVMNSDGDMKRLTADGPALGLADEIAPAQTIPWQKGSDTLLLFTDGIVDSRSESGGRLGEAKVLEVIKKNRSKSPDEIVQAVFKLLERHAGAEVSPDDLTLLVVRS